MKKNSVFIISLGITAVIILLGAIIPEQFAVGTNTAFALLTDNFSWLYLVSMFTFVAFSIAIAFSRFGKIKLGDDDSKPEHGTLSWFAMLFGAGMGIGLVFWGTAEPLNHYMSFGGITEEAKNIAMRKSFMHWGFHPWAGYSVVGLGMAYFQYRRKAPGLISSIFLPLIGEKGVRGPVGKFIDILAVFATVAGICTSLGLGALQINGGLSYLFGIPHSILVQFIIVAIITLVYTFTAVSGIDKGIKKLSDINMVIALALLAGAFLIGPKLMDINIFVNTLGGYVSAFVQDSFAINPFGDRAWLSAWTIFYWAWWIAWGPFVGLFIARISKGRTIKEFILGVMFEPSLFSLIWFSIFGGMGLNLDNTVIMEAVKKTETALFVVFAQYNLGFFLSLVAVCLLVTFFATSANTGTFVCAMLSSGGDLNPGNAKKIIWGILMALLSLILLMTGGLQAVQICSIVGGFPFAIIMVLCCVSLYKGLLQDERSKLSGRGG